MLGSTADSRSCVRLRRFWCGSAPRSSTSAVARSQLGFAGDDAVRAVGRLPLVRRRPGGALDGSCELWRARGAGVAGSLLSGDLAP